MHYKAGYARKLMKRKASDLGVLGAYLVISITMFVVTFVRRQAAAPARAAARRRRQSPSADAAHPPPQEKIEADRYWWDGGYAALFAIRTLGCALNMSLTRSFTDEFSDPCAAPSRNRRVRHGH